MKSILDLVLHCKMDNEESKEAINYDKLLFIHEINKMPWPKFNELCNQLLASSNSTSDFSGKKSGKETFSADIK